MVTPETEEDLRERAETLFSGESSRYPIEILIDRVSRIDDPELRGHLIEGEARYARPVDPNEEIGLGLALPFVAGKGARKGKAGGKRRSRQTRRFVLPAQDRKIDWNLELSAPERRHFPDTGTTLYSVPNQPVAEWVLRNGRPLGFKSNAAFRHFTDRLQGEIGKLDPKARIAMRGSSINGLSFDDVNKEFSGRFFDTKVDNASDFDIAIVSPELLKLARQKGITVLPRNGGLRTGPLKSKNLLERLELWDLLQRLRSMSGNRRISFMIYESVEQLERRSTMMLLR